MAENVIDLLVKGTNQASPVLKQVQTDMQGVEESARKVSVFAKAQPEDFVRWGNAWGTSATKAKVSIESVVGSLLNLAGPITTVVGLGTGLIAFLSSVNAGADKALASINKLSKGIEADMAATINKVAQAQAKAANDRVGVIELSYKAEVDAANRAAEQKLTNAKEELDKTTGLLAKFTGERKIAEAQYAAESAAIESERANKIVRINVEKNAKLDDLQKQQRDLTRQLTAEAEEAEAKTLATTLSIQGKVIESLEASMEKKQVKLDEDHQKDLDRINKLFGATKEGLDARLAAEREYQAKVALLETETAFARKKALEDLRDSAIGIFQDLGAEFADVVKELKVAEFIGETQKAMAELEEAFNQGVVSQEAFTKGMTALQERLNMLATGELPEVKAKTDELSVSVENLGEKGESASERWLKSIEGISPALDAIIAKARQAASAVSGAAGAASGSGGGGGGATSSSSGGGTTPAGFMKGGGVDFLINQPKGSGLTPLTGGGSQHYGLDTSTTPNPYTSSSKINVGGASDPAFGPQPSVYTFPIGLRRGAMPRSGLAWLEEGETVNTRDQGRAILDALRESRGGGVTVVMEAGAVVVQSPQGMTDREIDAVVEVLGQRLDQRQRQRAGVYY